MRATFRSLLPRVPLVAGTAEALPFRPTRLRRRARRAGLALVRPRPRRRGDGRGWCGRAAASAWCGMPEIGMSAWVDRHLDDHGWRGEASALARPRALAGRLLAPLPGFEPMRDRRVPSHPGADARAGRATDRLGQPRRGAARSPSAPPSLTKSAPSSTTTIRRHVTASVVALAVPRRLHRVPAAVTEPPLPHGRRVELPGRGTTFVREIEGPPGAPTLLLLHGWIASGGHELVPGVRAARGALPRVAPDLRGHATRPADPPHLPPRRLCRRRRRDARRARHGSGHRRSATRWAARSRSCCGAATATSSPALSSARPRRASCPGRRPRLAYQSWMLGGRHGTRLAAFAPAVPGVAGRSPPPERPPEWVAAELRRHDWRMIVEAGQSLSTYYAGRWIGEVDVPTSVVCTTEDRAVRPELQRAMAAAIPGCDARRRRRRTPRMWAAAVRRTVARACLEVADRATSARNRSPARALSR